MVRKASTCERQTEVAGKKKLVAGVDRLVAGVDFAPPEPIASVLPRIPLTTSQADDLWALVLPQIPLTSQADDLWEGRRRNPTDAEMAKEILASANLANAVQRALEFYVRDVIFLSDVPQFRRRLKTLHNCVTRFLATWPQEHDPVGYFLKRTYTGEIFLKDQLRPTDEKIVELEQAWSEKHGLAAIRNSLAEFQKNIDTASFLLSGTRPRDVAVEKLVSSLAHAWKAATDQWPKSSRDPYQSSHQSGPFADFVFKATAILPSEFCPPSLDHAIRSVCDSAPA